jgi:hypothetical protein
MGGQLTAVSCVTASFCVVLGGPTDAMSWNGRTWRQMIIPDINFGSITSLSCVTASFCMAIGYEQGEYQPPPPNVAIASVWNGHEWSATTGSVAMNSAVVSCTRRLGCTAVGGDNLVFLQRFGQGWSGYPAPQAGNLGPVSCADATTCVAVGGATADAWNGKSWRATTTKPAINPDGVSQCHGL